MLNQALDSIMQGIEAESKLLPSLNHPQPVFPHAAQDFGDVRGLQLPYSVLCEDDLFRRRRVEKFKKVPQRNIRDAVRASPPNSRAAMNNDRRFVLCTPPRRCLRIITLELRFRVLTFQPQAVLIHQIRLLLVHKIHQIHQPLRRFWHPMVRPLRVLKLRDIMYPALKHPVVRAVVIDILKRRRPIRLPRSFLRAALARRRPARPRTRPATRRPSIRTLRARIKRHVVPSARIPRRPAIALLFARPDPFRALDLHVDRPPAGVWGRRRRPRGLLVEVDACAAGDGGGGGRGGGC
mmetsp:Transcript_11692/g.30912  ORF Transcript_11692/g.30912 Transcript_11692/m.30912 type:complete len:294 (+) Transcript_11692:109-990(+)